MAIKAMPIVSDRVFLSDLLGGADPATSTGQVKAAISRQVAVLEGDCSPDERAWVIVRQATEADNMRRSGRVAKRTVKWGDGGDVEETRDDNLREQWAYEIYLCLCETGNIANYNGEPLFKFKDAGGYQKVAGGFEQFLKAYGSLPSAVTAAIRRAVLDANSDWDWLALGETSEGEE